MSIVTINDENLKDIGNAIRTKTGGTKKYKPSEMANAISSIQGQEPKLQQKSVAPTTTVQTIKADSSYDGLSSVSVGAVTSAIDSDIKSENIKKGVSILGVNGTLEEGIIPSGTKTINDNGDYDVSQYANAKVSVPKGITPSGELPITENGTYDVTNYASAVVNVASSGGGNFAPRFVSFYSYPGSELTIELETLDTSNVTDMTFMFSSSKIVSADLSKLNTSNVTTMKRMFNSCMQLQNVKFGNIDTSSVTNMEYIFNYCYKLVDVDLSSLNTKNVTNMAGMFYGCETLSSLNMSNINTSNVTNMTSMFQSCEVLTELDLSSFNTSKVTVTSNMFCYCDNLRKLDIRNCVFSHLKSNYIDMFKGVPANCLIIVKNNTEKNWVLARRSDFTNVKTLAEYQAEGGE